ncbi:ATP-binding cassette domain-containing protein [Hyperthermus butylicus]|uniref:ABC (ATP-binding cassette) transporter nucleotide-binding domain n=1 Tax=Hyperthermus butylicus (strain DSM 5456 / JCM 9403 / PLM1-5) TaxID=415426 RepID=A2BJ84_HYPBU|nr:ATP-binding cassette domain-containing protein [Hyperthermus butylicus]ABM80045.1 ABC (ATP-binding cassette) transporter nucleotide-binding domain [Hyperthermus butylicus DSM 5456]
MQHVLEAENVTVEFNGRIVLRDINLKLESGKLTVILGPNGAGKTTLLKDTSRDN